MKVNCVGVWRVALGLALLLGAPSVWADCTSPYGQESSIEWFPAEQIHKYCDDTDTWQSLGGGEGDRIVSGTLAAIANSETSIISLSTAGTTWGYLGSGMSYLPTVTAGQVSATNISSSLIQVGDGNSASCDSSRKGALRYSDISSTVEYCNSSAWLSLGPSATVIAFNAQRDSAVTDESTVIYNVEHLDTVSAYNTSTGVFTAPATGVYAFSWGAIGNGTNGIYRLHLRKNGLYINNNAQIRMDANASGTDYPVGSRTELLYLSEDDEISIFYSNDATSNLLGQTTNYVYFSGFYINSGSSGSGGGASALNDLTDVNTAGAAAGNVLRYDGSDWVVSETSVARAVSATGAIQFSADGAGAFGGNTNLFWDNASGELGIGTTDPSATLHVIGDIYFTGVMSDVSDRRAKKDVLYLGNDTSERLALLKPASYRMRNDDETFEYGFIAQEMEEVFPELVLTNGKGPDAMKSVNYLGLIAPMVKSIQDLKQENERLRADLEELKAGLHALTAAKHSGELSPTGIVH